MPEEQKERNLFNEAVEKTTSLILYQESAGRDALIEQAKTFQIIDLSSNQTAKAMITDGKDFIRHIEGIWAKDKKNAYDAWKRICDIITTLTEPVQKFVVTELGKRSWEWEREQKRIAQEAEEKRQVEEKKRIEEERLAQAERLEKMGEHEKASAVLEQPITVAPKEIETPPKDDRVSFRNTFAGKVVNVNLIPREYMVPDLVKLNKVTKALGAQTNIPGWEVFEIGQTAVKRK